MQNSEVVGKAHLPELQEEFDQLVELLKVEKPKISRLYQVSPVIVSELKPEMGGKPIRATYRVSEHSPLSSFERPQY